MCIFCVSDFVFTSELCVYQLYLLYILYYNIISCPLFCLHPACVTLTLLFACLSIYVGFYLSKCVMYH